MRLDKYLKISRLIKRRTVRTKHVTQEGSLSMTVLPKHPHGQGGDTIEIQLAAARMSK